MGKTDADESATTKEKMEKVLEIRNLSVEYYRRKKAIPAVRNVSLDLNEGEVLGVVGESGCGKSTLALAILRLIQPNEGEILAGEIIFKDTGYRIPDSKYTDMLKSNDEELRKIRGGKISIIFQDPFSSLNPVTRVGEQIAETIRIHQQRAMSPEKVGINSEQRVKEKVLEILKQVRILEPERVYNSYPHQLSGGMQQRAMIAMAISSNPNILIADEPTTALDVTTQKEILELIETLRKELNMTVILITHNFAIIAQYARRIAVMYAGEIVEEGGVREVFAQPFHPYTRALTRALPELVSYSPKKSKRLKAIPGQVPDMLNLPEGCKFHPRCEKKMEICTREIPEIRNVENRKVRCFLYPASFFSVASSVGAGFITPEE